MTGDINTGSSWYQRAMSEARQRRGAFPLLPLIFGLNFIHDKKKWGYAFRFGLLEINRHDFELISSQMLQKDYA